MIYRKKEGCTMRTGFNYIYDRNKWNNDLLTIGLYFMLPVWRSCSRYRLDSTIGYKVMAYKTYHWFIGFRLQPRLEKITFSWGQTTRLGRTNGN